MSKTRPTRGPSLNRRQHHFGWSQMPRNQLAHAIHVNYPGRAPPAELLGFWPRWGGYW